MRILTAPYLLQSERWPNRGRHILAQFDSDSVIVYQAYRAAIGNFAAEHGYFGGEFRLNRMSWIKTNFLWMMYRCGWAGKEGQEFVLAVRLRRWAFDHILDQAVHSHFQPHIYPDEAAWTREVSRSSVRLQWDPDRLPSGARSGRRAIQLGLRGHALSRYSREWIIDIEDISEFVREQRRYAMEERLLQYLITPYEDVYPVQERETAARLGLTTVGENSSTSKPNGIDEPAP